MKESERLRVEYNWTKKTIWFFSISEIVIVLGTAYVLWLISIEKQLSHVPLYVMLGFFIFVFATILWLIFGMCLPDVKRQHGLMRRWQWLESESEDLPANLKRKCGYYTDALEIADGYRKDVARMEERARSIKAEIETELENKK